MCMDCLFKKCDFLENYFRKKSTFLKPRVSKIFSKMQFSEYFLKCNIEAFPMYFNGLIILQIKSQVKNKMS